MDYYLKKDLGPDAVAPFERTDTPTAVLSIKLADRSNLSGKVSPLFAVAVFYEDGAYVGHARNSFKAALTDALIDGIYAGEAEPDRFPVEILAEITDLVETPLRAIDKPLTLDRVQQHLNSLKARFNF